MPMKTMILISLILLMNVLPAGQDAPKKGLPAASEEVRFRLASPSRPVLLVPVYVKGQGPFEFVLDTGASATVVSAEFARANGIQGGASKEGVGAGGKVQISMGSVESLTLGGAEVRNLAVAIMDLDALRAATGAKFDGILGYNFLKQFRVTIDYRKGTLQLE